MKISYKLVKRNFKKYTYFLKFCFVDRGYKFFFTNGYEIVLKKKL